MTNPTHEQQQLTLAANLGQRYARRFTSMTAEDVLSHLAQPNSPLMRSPELLLKFKTAFVSEREGARV